MYLRDDERAASVQIGAVILFGFVIVSMAVWQAQVVPQENARVEYTHNQRVQDDMQSVRNAVVSAPGGGAVASVAVDMAPQYPTRTLFVNPGPPTGTLRTVGTTRPAVNLTVDNAVATDADAADFWDGDPVWYNTGGLAYEPGYNVFTGAPTTVYENSVLYNVYDDGTNVSLAGQDLVDGTTVTLVTLNGSLSKTSADAYTVDPETLSASTRTVAVTNASGNVTVSFASRRDATWWNGTLRDELDEHGGYVVDVRSTPITGEFYNVTVELAGNETYTLRMAKVGVGSATTGTDVAYLAATAGTGASVPEGTSERIVLETRDAYNNPIADVEVSASVNTSAESLGGLDAAANATSNGEGQVVLELEAGEVDGVQRRFVAVNVSFAVDATDGPAFEPSSPASVTVLVEVRNSDGSGLGGGPGGGGDDAYTTDWENPATQNGVTCDAEGDDCTLDAGVTDTITLTGTTTPTAQGAPLDFAVSNTSVGTLSVSEATTDSTGEATTEFTATQNGTVKLYVSGGGSGDVVNLTVENMPSDQPPNVNTFTVEDRSNSGQGPRYDLEWDVSDPDGNLGSVTVYVNNTDAPSWANTDRVYTGSSGFATYNPNTFWDDSGDSIEVKIVAEDTAGNRVCYVITDTADGNGNYAKADATEC